MDTPDLNTNEQTVFTGDEPLSQESSMPLGTGEFDSQADIDHVDDFDVLASSSTGPRINTGTLLIIVVVGCAIGGLFCMRFLANVTRGAAADNVFELVVDQFFQEEQGESLLNENEKTMDDSALAVLSQPYIDYQVPLSDIQRNPFILFWANDPGANASDDNSQSEVDWAIKKFEEEKSQRKTQLEQAVADIRVTTVLMGETPLARVNGKVVQVGDTVVLEFNDITFQVNAIVAGSVTFLARDEHYDLSVWHTVGIHRR